MKTHVRVPILGRNIHAALLPSRPRRVPDHEGHQTSEAYRRDAGPPWPCYRDRSPGLVEKSQAQRRPAARSPDCLVPSSPHEISSSRFGLVLYPIQPDGGLPREWKIDSQAYRDDGQGAVVTCSQVHKSGSRRHQMTRAERDRAAVREISGNNDVADHH